MTRFASLQHFRTPVLEALEEWKECLSGDTKGRTNMPDTNAYTDRAYSEVLEELRTHSFLSFEGWRAEEVLVYLCETYPLEELKRLTRSRKTSQFLEQVHEDWNPRFLDWMHVMWRFSGLSHELFADIVYLLPDSQKASDAETGRVLFRELIWQKVLPEGACASLAGALIQWPRESTLGMRHATDIYHLAKDLSPQETGFLCRSLVMFRAMSKCQCGYERNEQQCICGKMSLKYDPDQDYVTVLFQQILADHAPTKVIVEDRWSEEQAEEFLRSACEYVFSEPAYNEIVHAVLHGKRAKLKQQHPRSLTPFEKEHRGKNWDCKPHMVEHNTCVHEGCPQMIKAGCANLSCKTHCTKDGMLECHTHRYYTPRPLPKYPQRRSIRQHA